MDGSCMHEENNICKSQSRGNNYSIDDQERDAFAQRVYCISAEHSTSLSADAVSSTGIRLTLPLQYAGSFEL